jgi:predicted MFS family arabinose efflux permease
VTPVGGTHGASPRFVLLLAVICAVTVANLYYLQPLLGSIAADFGSNESSTGSASALLQAGYAAGLLLIVPLGDMVSRRPLVTGLLAVDAVALAAMALAPSLPALTAAAVVVGLSSVGVQILVPFAATVATDEQRGRVLGTLLSAMLIGVLLSRVVAGTVADALGWRGMFAVAAVLMVGACVAVSRTLTAAPPEISVRYRDQLRAIRTLVGSEPVLRSRSFIGAAVYGAFNVLWTTVAFLLAAPPYRFGETGIGLFALVGVAGVAGAWFTGRWISARWNPVVTVAALLALLLSFALLGVGADVLVLVIIGVLVLDAAVQAVHLLNQNSIYGLSSGVKARLTTVYMTSYFIGGAAGSAAGAGAYLAGGWPAACAVGAGFVLVALAAWTRGHLRSRRHMITHPTVAQERVTS